VDGEQLFAEVALVLYTGQRIALLGANGSGKSTLLQLLAGVRQGAAGAVSAAPGAERTFVTQTGPAAAAGSGTVWQQAEVALRTVTDLERQLRSAEATLGSSESLARYAELHDLFEQAGGYGAQGRLRELLALFGIPEARHTEAFAQLSAGEQKRVKLAAALAAPPGILLLDEPDAALDEAARAMLAAQLRSYAGGVIFSSHDRAFIDSVASHTAFLRQGRLHLTTGGYARQQLAGRSGQRAGRARAGVVTPAAGAWRLRSAAASTRPGRLLLKLGPLELPLAAGEPEAGMLQLPELTVTAGDRIVLLGPNGSGKSTLLQFLADSRYAAAGNTAHWSDGVQLEHWDQPDRGLQPGEPVLGQLQQVTSAARAGQLLGLLRVPHRVWQLPPQELSGGERARVAAARLIAVEAELLLLDEPTVDLDISAIENLQDALLSTAAAVLLVTHDLALAEAVADRVWALEHGRLVEYRGGLAGYRAGRKRREPGIELLSRNLPVSAGTSDSLEAAEDELLAIQASLADPLLLSDREQSRRRRRQRELQETVDLLIDATFTPAAPRFSVREAGITVQADREGSTLAFQTDAAANLQLLVHGEVAHLLLQPHGATCLLPWARGALLNAATRLAFYCLDIRVVQYAHADGLPRQPAGLLLRPAGGSWFVLSRQDFVRLERWQQIAANATMQE
jgi:ATP-binding cassette subfamily F protein 3